jgi:ubiquinone/menaquinone biosynthesis C-methylase UbiE
MDEWRKKRDIMLHYNQTAASYDALYAKEQSAKIEAALGTVALKKDSLMLDMGCGTGLLFPHIADKSRLLVGVDVSNRLLKQAQKRAKQHANITLVQADADHTPFKNRSFHNVFAITLLQNTPNPTATLREIVRIAKPEATIMLTILKKKSSRKLIEELLEKAQVDLTPLETGAEIKDHIITCKKQQARSDD